jgi:hypothetical protein
MLEDAFRQVDGGCSMERVMAQARLWLNWEGLSDIA